MNSQSEQQEKNTKNKSALELNEKKIAQKMERYEYFNFDVKRMLF